MWNWGWSRERWIKRVLFVPVQFTSTVLKVNRRARHLGNQIYWRHRSWTPEVNPNASLRQRIWRLRKRNRGVWIKFTSNRRWVRLSGWRWNNRVLNDWWQVSNALFEKLSIKRTHVRRWVTIVQRPQMASSAFFFQTSQWQLKYGLITKFNWISMDETVEWYFIYLPLVSSWEVVKLLFSLGGVRLHPHTNPP